MKDYVVIGSVPYDEPCAQVGSENYRQNARKECKDFRRLIEQKCGKPPVGAALKTKGFSHDFGTYYEVVVEYDTESEEAESYAFFVEANAPETWNDKGRVR